MQHPIPPKKPRAKAINPLPFVLCNLGGLASALVIYFVAAH